MALELAAAQVTRGGREVALTRTEYLLLELFLRNPGRVLSHWQIIPGRFWPADDQHR